VERKGGERNGKGNGEREGKGLPLPFYSEILNTPLLQCSHPETTVQNS